jgi:hypothetical protein
MKIEFFILAITAFLVFNAYKDNRYLKMLSFNKKYVQMAMFGFVGLSLFLFIKKHPTHSSSMLAHASDLVKYIPIDKDSVDMITPIFDLTNITNSLRNPDPTGYSTPSYNMIPQHKRMLNSGGSKSRSVSETKKKYVASQQGWRCNMCDKMLDATFEVDHKIDLQYGGTNHVNNLHALCVSCHKNKFVMNKINE